MQDPYMDNAQPVTADALRFTQGEIESPATDLLTVRVSRMRAVVSRDTPQHIELLFRYLGPSSENRPLSSGEERRQVGLKLQSQDPCNLIYVMWRLEPERKPDEVVVSRKYNPGKRTSKECGNGGYVNLKSKSAPKVKAGSQSTWHHLRAHLQEGKLTVTVDQNDPWVCALDKESVTLHGPVGIRTDNGEFDMRLFIGK
jgi:hypothetical protein